jgi:hypothetical protein
MPILRLPNNDDPLTQGDILQDLHLYATGSDWADGGSPERLEGYDLSLILSRPCVIVHKPQIVVAAVKGIKEEPQDVETFEKVREFLTQLRDGQRRPDRFYLGQIPDYPAGRYYAHLDSLHSVAVPPRAEVYKFLKVGRIATLTKDFRRDLHVRIFSAVANLGFDDFGWYSDEDLKWLVPKGREKLQQMKTELEKKQAKLAQLQASGTAKDDRHIEGLEQDIGSHKRKVEEFEQELKGYEEELFTRNHHE